MTNKVGMISLGCPKNQVDGEIMLEKLNKSGFEIAQSIEDSDVMIINTCGFIEDAKREAIETILEVAEYKKAGIISAIVVTGCLAERYQDEIIKEIPEVDSVIGIGADNDIVKVCHKALLGVRTSFYPDKKYLLLEGDRMLSTPKHWAYLKISDGCDNRCSYCAIPLIRGGYIERPMESIIKEAQKLANKGIKELIIIAQATKYGLKLYGEYKLASLLKKLVRIDGIEWIRLYYCYPDRVTDELIDVIANEEKICPYIDIPLQHCNKDILKSMNRSGSYEELKALLNKMKAKIPDFAIRTTFMVGFPNESEENFEELCKFVKEIKFDKMGCFTYSPEEDTLAATFEDHATKEEIQNRFDRLIKRVSEISGEEICRYKGQVMPVLIESVSEQNQELLTGRLSNNILVHFKGDPSMIGEIRDVSLDECKGFYYMGNLV